MAFLKQSVLEEAQESIFCLYERIKAEQKIVLMTDHPEAFVSLQGRENLIIETISDSMIQDWIGVDNYVFNVKIMGLKYFFEKYDADVLFFDSDTFLLKDYTPLFEFINTDSAILHVGNPMSLHRLMKLNYGNMNYNDFVIENKQIVLGDNPSYRFDVSFFIFNSGVIGLSKTHKHLLEDVLYVTKQICSYKLRTAEELAFSLVLQQNKIMIKQCDDFVFHYFFAKWTRFLLRQRRLPLSPDSMQVDFKSFLSKYNIHPGITNLVPSNLDELPFLINFIDKELLFLDSIENDYFYMGGKGSYMANLKDSSAESNLRYMDQYIKQQG
jgi:hypothetical protein